MHHHPCQIFQALNSYYKNNLFLIEKLNLIKASKQMDKQNMLCQQKETAII